MLHDGAVLSLMCFNLYFCAVFEDWRNVWLMVCHFGTHMD